MKITKVMKNVIAEKQVEDKIRVVATGCMGLCAQGPLIRVEIKGQKDVLFKRVDLEAVQNIMDKYVLPALENDGEMQISEDIKQHVLSLELPFFTKRTSSRI